MTKDNVQGIDDSSDVKTVLIFGITSMVGSNLANFLKKDFKVVGTYHKTKMSIPGILTLPCDILNKEEVQLAVFASQPDICIYCVGLSSLIDSSKSDQLSDALNTIGLFNAAEFAQRYKARIIHISSGHVFGGEEKLYKENDIPDSNTTYGKTKAQAEFYLQKSSLNYLVFRCCKLYGRSFHSGSFTLFEALQYKLAKGMNVSMDNNVHMGFLDVQYLAILIKICIDRNVSNRILQLSSSDQITTYKFSQTYAKVFKESETLVEKGRWLFPHISSTTSSYSGGDLYYKMDTSNIENFLNISLPSVEESLAFTHKRLFGSTAEGGSKVDSDAIQFI